MRIPDWKVGELDCLVDGQPTRILYEIMDDPTEDDIDPNQEIDIRHGEDYQYKRNVITRIDLDPREFPELVRIAEWLYGGQDE